jgi:hypothetical protein
LFPDNPQRASPYSPATWPLLNVLNIDVAAIPGLRKSPETQAFMGFEEFWDRPAIRRDFNGIAAIINAGRGGRPKGL